MRTILLFLLMSMLASSVTSTHLDLGSSKVPVHQNLSTPTVVVLTSLRPYGSRNPSLTESVQAKLDNADPPPRTLARIPWGQSDLVTCNCTYPVLRPQCFQAVSPETFCIRDAGWVAGPGIGSDRLPGRVPSLKAATCRDLSSRYTQRQSHLRSRDALMTMDYSK